MRVPKFLQGLTSRAAEPAEVRSEDRNAAQEVRQTVVPMYTTDHRRGTALNAKEWLDRTTQSSWLLTAIFRISQSVPQAKIVIRRNGVPVADSDPWAQRLANPNPVMTQWDMMESSISWLETTGNVFWMADDLGGSLAVPLLYVAKPTTILIVPDPKTGAAEYIQRVKMGDQEQQVAYTAKEVCHFKRWNPYSDQWGMPPQAALDDVLETEYQANQYNKNFFTQGARLSGVLETDRNLHSSDRERMLAEFEQRHAGLRAMHRPAFLEGGVKFKPISSSPADTEFLQGSKFRRQSILAAYGIPPAIAGIFEYGNYANTVFQYKVFWNETLGPRLRSFTQQLTLFLRHWDPALDVVYDLSDVPALQELPEVLAARLVQLLAAGAMTVNEVRQELQLEPLTGGDVTVASASAHAAERILAMSGLDAWITERDFDEMVESTPPEYADQMQSVMREVRQLGQLQETLVNGNGTH